MLMTPYSIATNVSSSCVPASDLSIRGEEEGDRVLGDNEARSGVQYHARFPIRAFDPDADQHKTQFGVAHSVVSKIITAFTSLVFTKN